MEKNMKKKALLKTVAEVLGIVVGGIVGMATILGGAYLLLMIPIWIAKALGLYSVPAFYIYGLELLGILLIIGIVAFVRSLYTNNLEELCYEEERRREKESRFSA